MIYVFYVFLLVGVVVLVADLTGKLRFDPARFRWWRNVGAIAAIGILGAGLFGVVRAQSEAPFLPWLSVAYVVASATYVASVVVPTSTLTAAVHRSAYVSMLLLGALPSWLFLAITPAIALASMGLASLRDDDLPASH